MNSKGTVDEGLETVIHVSGENDSSIDTNYEVDGVGEMTVWCPALHP